MGRPKGSRNKPKPQQPNVDLTSLVPALDQHRADEIVSVLKLRAQSLTLDRIAELAGFSQGKVSAILRQYGQDSRKEARAILEAKAAAMALDVVENGRPADKLRALEGTHVVLPQGANAATQGIQIYINGISLGGLGLPPSESESLVVEGESSRVTEEKPAQSDN